MRQVLAKKRQNFFLRAFFFSCFLCAQNGYFMLCSVWFMSYFFSVSLCRWFYSFLFLLGHADGVISWWSRSGNSETEECRVVEFIGSIWRWLKLTLSSVTGLDCSNCDRNLFDFYFEAKISFSESFWRHFSNLTLLET